MDVRTEILERVPILATDEQDIQAIRQLERLLAQTSDDACCPARLVAPDGQTVTIPAPICRVLRQITPLLAQGDGVAVVPLHREMSTQEAADYLNMSRPSLIKLLEDGTIPYTKVGSHRRVRFDDVMAYKQRRSEGRKELFAYMLAVAQEHNAYD